MQDNIPLRWKGKEYTAVHALSCVCRQGFALHDAGHEWRILDSRGGYLFHERDAFVIKHATELWSADDPFMEREPLAEATGK